MLAVRPLVSTIDLFENVPADGRMAFGMTDLSAADSAS